MAYFVAWKDDDPRAYFKGREIVHGSRDLDRVIRAVCRLNNIQGEPTFDRKGILQGRLHRWYKVGTHALFVRTADKSDYIGVRVSGISR
jgi:hypothetical protein